MVYWWLAVPLAIAILDWIAIARNWTVVHAFAKQGVIIALIAWSWFAATWQGLFVWFVVALVFSLVGDILLLSPRLFLPGMGAFFLALIAYLLGLNLNTTLLSPIPFGIVLGAIALTAFFFPRIRTALRRKPGNRKLVIPVLVYSVILSLMVMSSVATLFRDEWAVWNAILMAAGGILFFISDNVNAQNRFVHPVRSGQLRIMVTYHLAQFALIAGAVLHFSSL